MANLSMTTGDTQQFQCNVFKNGAPVDLTGIQSLTFKLQQTGGSVLATWGLGSGVTVSSPATDGIAILTVNAAMLSWATGNHTLTYTWSMVDAIGDVTGNLESGTFSLTPAP